MALVINNRYAGDAAWEAWFRICSVAGCEAETARKLREQVESAMLAQLTRYGFSAEDAHGDDPVAFFDGYFKLKGSKDKAKPLKQYFACRLVADKMQMMNFVCGTLFGSLSGRIHDIVLDWIATLKGWKPRTVRGEDGKRHLVWENAGPETVAQIELADGDFNIGISSPKELEEFISKKRESGIFLTVFGVGRGNFMDANMKKLANAGNGNYAYLDSLLEAKKVMLNEFGGTLMTVAKDVKVQVEFNPSEVEGYRLLGYENRKLAARDFNDDKKDAGEIGAGHTMTAFYEIVPAGSGEKVGGTDPLKYQKRTAAGTGELCTVKLRYKLPDADTSTLVEEAHKAADITLKEPSEDFRFASAVAEFALLLKDSKHKGSASFTNLIERARDAKGVDREGYRAEFIRLAERAEATPVNRSVGSPLTDNVQIDVDF